MQVTTDQLRYIHKLMPEAIKNDKEQKAHLVMRFSRDLTKKSTTELSFDQANDLIQHYGGRPLKYSNWGAIWPGKNKQHARMYSVLIQLGWTKHNIEKQKPEADIIRFSEWLKNRKPFKKVKDMTPKECSKIISALEIMLEKSL